MISKKRRQIKKLSVSPAFLNKEKYRGKDHSLGGYRCKMPYNEHLGASLEHSASCFLESCFSQAFGVYVIWRVLA
jgi:hypothetical protein